MGQWWDPTDEWAVPKDWGTTGITVRTKDVTEPLTSWRQFLDLVPKYSGKVVFVDSPDDVFIAPLKANGYSLNSDVKEELDKAQEELMKVAPHILALDSNTYQDKTDGGGCSRPDVDRRHPRSSRQGRDRRRRVHHP